MQTLVAPWTADQKAAFLKRPMSFGHGLAETGLFTDEALVELLDSWPEDLYDINLFDFDEKGEATLRTGARGRLPGAQVLEGIKAGRIWIQLRRADRGIPALAEAMRAAFVEIGRQMPGFNPVNLNAQLIISAPQTKVAFHADAPGVILFHLRGRKRIWIYPADEAHMPQQGMEDIVLKQQTEDLPYNRGMDQAATVFDLEPGQAAAWPLHCPHRIENQGVFNVSLSVDYQTWETRLTNGAHYAAGILRRWKLPVPRLATAPAPVLAGLWALHLLFKRLPLVKDRIAHLDRTFELDGQPVTA